MDEPENFSIKFCLLMYYSTKFHIYKFMEKPISQVTGSDIIYPSVSHHSWINNYGIFVRHVETLTLCCQCVASHRQGSYRLAGVSP